MMEIVFKMMSFYYNLALRRAAGERFAVGGGPWRGGQRGGRRGGGERRQAGAAGATRTGGEGAGRGGAVDEKR